MIKKEKIHIKIQKHFIKQGKKIKTHIKKHHRKYTVWATIYSVFHIAIIKVLALKFLALKIGLWLLALLGIYESPMISTFAKIDNICIDNKPLIAEQKCEENFNTIEEVVVYIESQVDPDKDTIYDAGHYSILTSILETYCKSQIPESTIKQQTTILKSIHNIKGSNARMNYAKTIYEQWKDMIEKKKILWTSDFCIKKYQGYDTLRLAQKEFLKELKKNNHFNQFSISKP